MQGLRLVAYGQPPGGDLDCDSDPPGYESEARARHRLGCAVPARVPRCEGIVVSESVTVVWKRGQS